MQWSVEKLVGRLFHRWYGEEAQSIHPLPPSGSNRQYFRLIRDGKSFIGVFNPDTRENRAFVYMSRHFAELGLPVPQVLDEDTGTHCYLLNDLGDVTLFSLLPHDDPQGTFSQEIIDLYKKTIDYLPRFQISGANSFDFTLSYPRSAFDKSSMMWDLNYFKYYFLKISGIAFDEQKLEDDFEVFVKHLLDEKSEFFMYRDFQSRNIMVANNQPWFIDYQGGRRGPLQYDIASLLFDAKANIPFETRKELLDYYIERCSEIYPLDELVFRSYYYDFVLMRVMQALATYGFRGGVEKKPLFLQSMPYALNNLRWLTENGHLPVNIPYLSSIIEKVVAATPRGIPSPPKDGLTISIRSFSFHKGMPDDPSGNGGGFVFDCRALNNPGRQPEYANLSGKDREVIQVLGQDPAVMEFLVSAMQMVSASIEQYKARGFRNLMVSFGCTGGRHRSVYCAEQLAKMIAEAHHVHVEIIHREEESWGQTP